MKGNSGIFSDFLRELGVPHTVGYSERSFATMPFATMFGMSKLLESYGVESAGVELGDRKEIVKLPAPFIVRIGDSYAIVTQIDDINASYITQGVRQTVPTPELVGGISNRVFVARRSERSAEPGYVSHKFTEIANKAKKWVLAVCLAALLIWSFIAQGLYNHISLWLIAAIDIAGIYISTLLVQKSSHITSRHADAVCAVVQAGGCDSILNTSASKFFGIFGWSEVGLAYFSVSLLCLLMFPQYIGCLALCNVLCLPFSFWSVWYQRFKAKAWCTLCLCVQAMLWMLFFCYLGGGWLSEALPLRIEFIVLGVCYVAAMLSINAVMPLIDRDNSK